MDQTEQSLANLPINQLLQRQKEYEIELTQFQSAFQNLKIARDRYVSSNNMISMLKEDQKGVPAMIPLTSSLYVPGKMGDLSHVIVDVGTGYYVKKPVQGAKDTLDRRIKNIVQTMDFLQNQIAILQRRFEVITRAINIKQQQQK